MAFNEDGLHVDSDFTEKCTMLTNSSVITHSGYRSDMEDLLQEALLACNLLNLTSESSQNSGRPLIRPVSVISLSFLLSSCRLSEADRVDRQCPSQLWESTILAIGYASVGHETGERRVTSVTNYRNDPWKCSLKGVTSVTFCMVIHSQSMTLTFTDGYGWNKSFFK